MNLRCRCVQILMGFSFKISICFWKIIYEMPPARVFRTKGDVRLLLKYEHLCR